MNFSTVCDLKKKYLSKKISRKIPRGLVSSFDEEWRRCRLAFSKPLLRPTDVKQYRDVVKNATEQLDFFFDRSFNPNFVEQNMDTSGKCVEAPKYPDLVTLFKLWSLEIVCSIVFGKNQNFLGFPIDLESLKFIHAIDVIFDRGKYLYFLPPYLVRNYLSLTEKSNDVMKSWDFIFDFCTKRISDKLKETKENVQNLSHSEKHNAGENTDTKGACPWSEDKGFLEILIEEHPNLSDEEIISCTTEIIVGAIDQTSLTLAEVLGELGMNKHVQQDIRAEVNAMEATETSNFVLRAVLKEGFRMFPSMTRVIRANKTELELGIIGFCFPDNFCSTFSALLFEIRVRAPRK